MTVHLKILIATAFQRKFLRKLIEWKLVV